MNQSIFYGWKEVEAVYQSLKVNTLGISLYVVSISIAVIIMVAKGSKQFPKMMDESTGTIDMKSFLKTITPYIYGLMIVSAIPVIISTMEKGLSFIEQGIMSSLGAKAPKSIADALEKELIEKMGNGGILGIVQMDIAQMADIIGILVFKPLFAMLDQYLFAGALSIRYLYLLGLELVAPIAVVGLISEETQSWFFTWAKNMLACYLMIPMFLIALTFAEGLKQFLITESGITTFALFLVCFLKFSLFKFSATLVFKLI
ncbi:hypothetical protein [Sphingobacterium kitahiroshimense]|uniref:hypothetical protein n=1 Tax=Sphingobacterium kitahiroshimense TaxID=470446 RepID=UPI0032099474